MTTASPHATRAFDHHPHSQSRQQRPTPSRHPSVKTPASVGQPLPPSLRNDARSPAAQDVRTPSPNYFGLSIDSSADVFSSSAAHHARANWSPPTSDVRSTAAASPRIIPVDQSPEFETFRRQSESARKFNLGGGISQFSIPRPKMTMHRSNTSAHSPGQLEFPFSTQANEGPASPKSDDSSGSISTPEKPRSPKRTLSSDSNGYPSRPRKTSPAGFDEMKSGASESPKFVGNPFPRPAATRSPASFAHQRAETLPASFDDQSSNQDHGPILVTPQHIITLLDSSEEEILLLDLRVSTQYAISKIRGALNLCIPTTLIKRPSFTVEKLAETFKDDNQRRKFEKWRSCKYIVVYDADSRQLRDATCCVNTLNKFTNEGWTGATYIIRGGISEFAAKFPSFVLSGDSNNRGVMARSRKPALRLDNMPGPAPVIGGCPLPSTQNAANPFFGNIRQNMDLIGGVGQMPVTRPKRMNSATRRDLPAWLREASEEEDRGHSVSEKFLQIEKREQKRMQEALSGSVTYGEPGPEQPKAVQIAGIEKGNKNRYNNIWPFEHTRVKLQGVSSEGCDYVNANHIKPPWTNKRYIATQGPIPVTFADFWSVVWHQDVRVIVMLTAEKEGGQIKAHNYWQDGQYGPFRLNFHAEHRASLELGKIKRHHERRSTGRLSLSDSPVSPADRKPARAQTEENPFTFDTSSNKPSTDTDASDSEQPYVIVRKFTLSNTALPFSRMREITQLQYSSWPDFGAPAHPTHLLGLVEQTDAVVRQTCQPINASADEPDAPSQHPILVHCSAGCGRTGTFCTVDSVIDMLKRQRAARRAKRHASPMDLDRSPPKKRQSLSGHGQFEAGPSPAGGQGSGNNSNGNSGSSHSNSSSRGRGSGDFFFSLGGDGVDAIDEVDNEHWLMHDDVDLIEKTVETFRHQRLSMVQSLRQFVLCYESVLEWIVQEEQAG
ncbi:tyrosine-protein phosphatase-like protein non-receptor [Phyllosticta citriasiana]|uniref:protein-tyrosine-phosphatase n=1 Tax=Phyllosticta citriasiana TaxID=595635 RepID=A0ABR1KGS7_9PEZI